MLSWPLMALGWIINPFSAWRPWSGSTAYSTRLGIARRRCPPSLLADGKNIQSLETNLSQEIVGGTSSAAAMDGQAPKMTRMSNHAATTVIRAQRRLSIDSPGRGVVLRENGGGQKRLAARILAYTSLTEPSF